MSKEFENAIVITYSYYLDDTKIILHFMSFGREMAKKFIKDCVEKYHFRILIDSVEVENIVKELCLNEYFEIEKGE